MGGCRCSFRDCKVNTYKNKRMHFFRYPIKSLDRFKKWREYAKTEMMLTFSEVRQQNLVVCARHFRSEYFMNYKKDRLTQSAIPTLMRLSTTHALDFEQDVDNGVLITMEEPKQKHLIAPENFKCPLDLDADEELFDLLNKLQKETNVAVADEEEYDEYANPSKDSNSIIPTKSQDVVEYDASEVSNYGRVKGKPLKSSSNTFEILETIQVTANHLKRPRSETEDHLCKKRIDNSYHIVNKKPKHTVIVPFTEDFSQTAPGYAAADVNHIPTVVQNDLIDQEDIPIIGHVFNDGEDDDDNNVEFFEIHNEDDLHYVSQEDDFETNDINTTIVQLKTDYRQDNLTSLETTQTKLLAAQQEIGILKKQLIEEEILQAKVGIFIINWRSGGIFNYLI